MKRIFFLLSFASSIHLQGQVVALQNDKDNIIYTCVDNEVTVACVKFKSAAVILECNDVQIIPNKSKGPGHYIIRVLTSTPNVVEIKMKTRAPNGKLKTISQLRYRVKSRRELSFGGQTDGVITKTEVCADSALQAEAAGKYFPVLSFTNTIISEGDTVYTGVTTGKYITARTKEQLRKLRDRDVLIFSDVLIADCDSTRNIGSLKLTISDPENPR